MNRTEARRVFSSYVETPVARLLARLGLTPNAVTLLGLAVAGGSAYLLSIGNLWAGGVVLLFSGIFDLFDGALARLTGRVTKFGAFLDSMIDRVSEAVVLLGLLVFYIHRASTEGTVLVYLALVGSIMVSYLRARAEGLGIECKVGIMTRPERVAVLGAGLVIGHWWPTAVLIVLGAIAGLTILTSAQRLFHAWKTLKNQG
jgi:CDP-diacylglycerol--glycerol-3-phosphate 3-phosphatidyltransferase